MINIRLFLILFVTIFVQPTYTLANGILKTYLNEKAAYLCLPSKEVGLLALLPEKESNLLTKSDVIAKLGKPDRVEGNSDFSKSYYGATKFVYGNDYVCSISTTSPSVHTPAGIHPGLDRQELFTIFGFKEAMKNFDAKSRKKSQKTYASSNKLSFMTCEGGFIGGGLIITFDESGDKITKLYAGNDCP